jgi:hypothetical protein
MDYPIEIPPEISTNTIVKKSDTPQNISEFKEAYLVKDEFYIKRSERTNYFILIRWKHVFRNYRNKKDAINKQKMYCCIYFYNSEILKSILKIISDNFPKYLSENTSDCLFENASDHLSRICLADHVSESIAKNAFEEQAE